MKLRKPAFVICTLTVAVLATVQLLTPRSTAYTPSAPMLQATEAAPISAWSPDMTAALEHAAKEHKDVLLGFSDSEPDAAGLKAAGTLNNAHFIAEASKRFILVNFSAGDQSPTTLTDRAAWADKLNVTSLPSVYLVDQSGRAAGKCSSLGGDAEKLLAAFGELADLRSRRDAAFAAADAAQGIEKAKQLDAGLTLLGDCRNAGYLDVMKQIVDLDRENAAGLRGKYQEAVSEANIDAAIQKEVYPLIDHHQFLAAIDRITKLMEEQSPSASQKQMLMAFQGQLYQSHGDKAQAIACLDRALAVDDAGPAVAQIRKARAHILEDQQ